MSYVFSDFKELIIDNKEFFSALFVVISLVVLILGIIKGWFRAVIKLGKNLVCHVYGDKKIEEKTIDEIKEKCRILFIDDEEFNYIDILKRNGWKNVKRIPDVQDIDNEDIARAHLLFVDIHGVANDLFKDEGLGLIRELKEKYPYKKYVIYTAESSGDRLKKELYLADKVLRKNADAYEFQKTAEELCSYFFSAKGLIENIKNIIKNDMEEKKLHRILCKLLKLSNLNEIEIKQKLKINGDVDKVIDLLKLFKL